jgi:Na+-driven multidrug efflux pump
MAADISLENVGLLGSKENSVSSSYYGAIDSSATVEVREPPASWKAIVTELLSMGMPLAGASVCSTLLPFVSLIFVGHYSKGSTSSDEIAASGLAVMLCNGE